MVYIHWKTGTTSLGRVFGRMELLTMVIVLGKSQFSTQILPKIKQFEKMKLFPVLDVWGAHFQAWSTAQCSSDI